MAADTDAPREHVFRPSRVVQLARELSAGELVYVDPGDGRSAPAKRHASERFKDLGASLVTRGLKLEPQGAGYWLAVACTTPARPLVSVCACCGYSRLAHGRCQRCLTRQFVSYEDPR